MLAKHIEHIADIAGIDRIGFGFDFCEFLEGEASTSCSLKQQDAKRINAEETGQTDTETAGQTSVLQGLRDASEVPNLLEAMRKIGFTDNDIRKVSYGNWHRVIRESAMAE